MKMDRPTHAPGCPRRRRRRRASILIALVAGLGIGAGDTLLSLHLYSLGDCRELAGLPTDQVVEVGLCDLPGQGAQIVSSTSVLCTDGRTLSWSDFGWGYWGEPWRAHSHGLLVPPQDELDACQP